MKRVLLVSNHVFHYRLNNYNYFYDEFNNIDIDFQVLTYSTQTVDFDIRFKLTIRRKGIFSFIKAIRQLKPSCVILFLHLKDYFIFPVIYYCKLKRIPVIYWNFGINIDTPDSSIKNLLYFHIHKISDAILIYSPNEREFIKPDNHKKMFFAYNTLNLTELNRKEFTDTGYLKRIYGIKERFIVFFAGKLEPVKRLDILLNCFRNDLEIAVVVAGKGTLGKFAEIIDSTSNYYYIGEIKYDNKELLRILNCIDILCIPGNVGLAIIEAFFWGKPVITLSGINSPEIYYLKDNHNGFIVDSATELEEKAIELSKDKVKYDKMSGNARKTYEVQAHISKMFAGFEETVKYLKINN